MVGRGPGQGREPEGRRPEAERHQLVGVGPAVEQQVAPGDADVELPGADVGGDVARAQEEELGVVVGVVQHELARLRALPVAGLAQHVGGGLGERSLVGDGDAEHGVPSSRRAQVAGGRPVRAGGRRPRGTGRRRPS